MNSKNPEDELRAHLEAATPGPWEPGDVWLFAGLIYSDDGERVEDGSATRCAFCHLGPPSWSGRTDINGTVMPAHRHRDPEPHDLEHAVSSADGSLVAYEGVGIVRSEDVQFFVSARKHVPALLSDVASLRSEVAAARKFAAEMRDFCSPHGVATDYADRLIEAMDQAKGERRDTAADTLAAEWHRRHQRLEELTKSKGPEAQVAIVERVRGELIGLRGALGVLLGGRVEGGTADLLGWSYYQEWRRRQEAQ